MKNMGEKGNYKTEKEVKIKSIDRNGEKQSGRRKIHDKNIHQSETKSVLLCRISVFATVKEGVGHFSVGLRLLSGLKSGSDVPGVFAEIHPCTHLCTLTRIYEHKHALVVLVLDACA